MVEHLPSILEALGSASSIGVGSEKKKKEEKEEEVEKGRRKERTG